MAKVLYLNDILDESGEVYGYETFRVNTGLKINFVHFFYDQQIIQIVTCTKTCNCVYIKLLCETYINRKYAAKWQDNLDTELREEDWVWNCRRYRPDRFNITC